MAFGIIVGISVVQWFVDGRRNFTGPRITFLDDVIAQVGTEEEVHVAEGKDGKGEK